MNQWNSIFFRYSFLLVLGLGNLFVFYTLFTPLTVYPVFGLINFFYEATLLRGNASQACDLATSLFPFLKGLACVNSTVFFKGYFASIVSACVAGSAYYLLLILNLSTPMSGKQRINSILFLIISFLLLNILRIFTFSLLFVNKGFEFFNIAHVTTWYFGSTVFVILLWFSNILIFKIKEIPLYSDFKFIIKAIKGDK